MNRIILLVILSMLAFHQVSAQDELDDFDFFEQKDEGEDDYFKKKDSGSKKKSKKKKVKDLLSGAYYHIPGNTTISGGFYFVNSPRSVAIPNSYDVEFTAVKNLSLGFRFVYYRYKVSEPLDSNRMTSTTWPGGQVWIGDNTYGGLATWHISDALGLDPDKLDLYVRGFVGSNKLGGDPESYGITRSDEEGLVFGGSIGAKFLYNDLISMFADLGYSKFGILNFGITYRILNLQL